MRVCQKVTKEPLLQPLSGEQLPRSTNKVDDARVDIKARGFWTGEQDAFFDIGAIHPFAFSYQDLPLSSVYRQHELKKRREYGQRIREVEHGGFTPLVFTTAGGTAPETTIFFEETRKPDSEKRGRDLRLHHGLAKMYR